MELGDRIRNIRQLKNLTQGELIEGIASITYLSKVENNQTTPTNHFIQKIADRLGISPDILFQQNLITFNEKLEKLYEGFMEKDKINEEDIAFLQIQVNETHVNQIYIMIFTILIRYNLIHSNLRKAYRLYQQSMNLIKSNDTLVKNHIYFHYYLVCGKLLLDLYIYPKANEYLQRCELFIDGVNDQNKAKLYFSLSLVSQKINRDKHVCLYYSGKSLDYQKKVGNVNRMVIVLLIRSLQFHLDNQPNDAANSLKEANTYSWDQNNANLRAMIECSMGSLYQAANDEPKAIKYFLKAIESFRESTFIEKSLQAHKRLVEIYIKQKDWKHVDKHLNQAQAIAQAFKTSFYDIEIDILQTSVYRYQNQDSNYEKAMRKLIEYCEEQKFYYYLNKLATEFGAYFFNKQSYKKSAIYFNQSFIAEQMLKTP